MAEQWGTTQMVTDVAMRLLNRGVSPLMALQQWCWVLVELLVLLRWH
jgi:hypothetical protein